MSKTIGMTTIRHVFGNTLRLAIPLTLRTVTLVDGSVTTTDSDFTPTGSVVVVFGQTARQVEFPATMRDGNVAVVVDYGTLPIGTYSITVLTHDSNGNPMRFKQRTVVKVVDATIDAGIDVGIEFESQEWLLDGAIFLAVQGVDGVGIESITTDESPISGEYNTITFNLTDGSSYTLHVRNGESTEQTLPANVVVDPNYVHTDNNYDDNAVALVAAIGGLFGNVSYDRLSYTLNFYSKDNVLLKQLNVSDFVRDSKVRSFTNAGGYLTIKLNSDGNNEEFRVSIDSIFPANNYYTKAQAENKFAQINDYSGKLTYSQAPIVILDFIDGVSEEAGEIGFGTIYGASNGRIMYCDEYENLINIGYSPSIIFYNIAEDGFYRYKSAQGVWERIGSYDGGSGTFVQEQVDWNEIDTTKPTFIKNKPTLFSGSYNDLTNKPTFNEMFAGVVYDSQTRRINFYGKGDVNHTTVLAYIDASPFIVDGMLSNVEVKNVTINGSSVPCFVFSFNTDSGKQNINIPTSSIFNAANYYTKAEIDNKGYLTIQANPDWDESDTTSPSYIQNKPTIHDNGIESITTQQDGVISIYLSNGDIYTIDLNHSHTQYVESSQLANVATSGSYNDLSDKPTILTKVQVSGNTPTQAMTSGLFYEFTGSLTSLTLTLTAPSSGLGVYAGKFTSDSTTATTLSVPASVVEASGNPTITVGKTYEFSIVDDVLLMVEV